MRRICAYIVFVLILFSALSSDAASYKINSNGSVKNPDGQVVSPKQTNYFNNYSTGEYVSNKTASKNSIGTIDIVMDYSGSMEYWINVAKSAMSNILSQLPDTVNIGFRTFGEYTINSPVSVVGTVKKVIKKDKGYKVQTENPVASNGLFCSNTRSLVGVTPKNTFGLLNAMNSAKVGGATPLTLALQQSVAVDFSNLPQTYKKKIILITDGGETCGGDPCAFARDLMSKRKDIVIDVVLVSTDSRALNCVANETGGKIYSADDPQSFTNAIDDSMTNEVEENSGEQYYEFVN